MSCIAIASYTKNLKPAEGLTSIHSNFSILTLYIKSFPCFELFYAHMFGTNKYVNINCLTHNKAHEICALAETWRVLINI